MVVMLAKTGSQGQHCFTQDVCGGIFFLISHKFTFDEGLLSTVFPPLIDPDMQEK